MSRRKPRVLLVDDEQDLIDLFQFYVEDAGADALTALSGKEAIALLRRESVDLVISDIRMPNGSGLDLLEWVKANVPQLPVALISGYADVDRAQLLQAGACELFEKPCEGSEFIEFVRNKLFEKKP